MITDRIYHTLFRKDVTFTVALFADDHLSLDVFNEQHLILKYPLRGLWKPKPLRFQADSFLFVKGDELFLFYESQHWDDPGCIVMSKTKDLLTWSKPVVVLSEPFHLSFPYVFEDHGNIYMIPESQESDTIRLYRANADLTDFRLVRILLKQDVYYKDDKYYLFTSYQKNWMYYQELYITDDLQNGEFTKHPHSPICVSNEFGRNAGSLIDYKGKLLRVTQDCHKDYGDNISLMEITRLDENHYEEQLFMHNVFPCNNIFVDGGHQLNIAQFRDKYIYATDYKINKWTWYQLYVAIAKKIGLHKR